MRQSEVFTVDSFASALGLQEKEVVSLVGGGGKTTLMFALANELASAGKVVVTTTTTKIVEPSPTQTQSLLLSPDEDDLLEQVSRETVHHITVARERLASGKLAGVSPGFIVSLARIKRVDYVIVEADGAAHRSLKAPNATEPVIPANTSLVIPVVGIDALDCPLTAEHVFRPEIAAALLGLPIGHTLSAEAIAVLVTHQNGLTKGSPAGARVTAFINKMDLCRDFPRALDLAEQILASGPRINRVVLGQASRPEAAKTVVARTDRP